MNTLVSPENTWVLMMVMLLAVAISIYLEQKYAWASRISGAVIALIIALVLVNTNIIPPHAELYDDIVWGYVVPIAIPLLLLHDKYPEDLAGDGSFAPDLFDRRSGYDCGGYSRVCPPWLCD